ncbi:MAG: alpha/beta hydrolase fold protein [Flavipsychrobacter sp.]|jgi:pimeloyl-ACP methyl ester carboxylesterase|nr:alpha/beta hydrolase fold protein [Flavipsychrobacter sp.]
MALNAHFVTIGKEKLHYLRWGSGKKLLLAFHGYGDDARIFYPLKEYLEQEYTILSIDLPHHGSSQWPDELFTKAGLMAMTKGLMAEYGTDNVSLIGYSMGGRVCLSIIQQLPDRIDKVALLASDGLTVNFYYHFFTRTAIGKKVFRHMLEKPGVYLKTIEMLRKMRIADAGRYKFAMHFLGEEDRRKFLLKVWPGMSDLVSSPQQLKAVIRKHKIPIAIFMGAYDKIIPVSQAKKFSRGLDTVNVHIVGKGHRLFDNETAQQIAVQLL